MNESKRQPNGHGVLIAVAVFFVVYVFVPFVLVLPMDMLNRATSGSLSEINRYIFLPLVKLDAHCPPYHLLIVAEGDFIEKLLTKVMPP